MVKVKICGITRESDALDAQDAGADALGFVFAPSPRRISVTAAKRIIRRLAPWTAAVGVFVNEKPALIAKIAREAGLTAVQLHGDESAAALDALKGLRRIKAFGVDEKFRPMSVLSFDAEAYLFDTRVKGLYGGSGVVFDWKKIEGRFFKRPVILSGGLTPWNVARAVRLVGPYGVDVSSGVERTPGIKDMKKVKQFIHNAKKA